MLIEAPRTIPYAEIATRLGSTEDAIATAVHRLRSATRKPCAGRSRRPSPTRPMSTTRSALFDALKS